MPDDPFNPVDEEARALARRLLGDARHAALATLRDGRPAVSRIGVAPVPAGAVSLVPDLAPHTADLRADLRAALLVGEPGKGDPLAHPRLSLDVEAVFIAKSDGAIERYLEAQPKARLYIGFADFHLVRFRVVGGLLNGGFGRAYRLAAGDLQ